MNLWVLEIDPWDTGGQALETKTSMGIWIIRLSTVTAMAAHRVEKTAYGCAASADQVFVSADHGLDQTTSAISPARCEPRRRSVVMK